MIVIRHGCKPGPKRWKFKCGCGCEWIADETEVARVHSYFDVCVHNLIYYHAISCCPDCGHNVEDERMVDADEYEKLVIQIDPSPFIKDIDAYVNIGQTEEEKPF